MDRSIPLGQKSRLFDIFDFYEEPFVPYFKVKNDSSTCHFISLILEGAMTFWYFVVKFDFYFMSYNY